jgi:lambda repressor-like predicted transcriptional regulator
MKTDYTDMTPVEIRVAILRAGTTQAAIARSASRDGQTCSRELVCRVIDGKVVSDRIRRAIADAISIPAERIWRSYYLSYEPGRRGRRVSHNNRSMTAAC